MPREPFADSLLRLAFGAARIDAFEWTLADDCMRRAGSLSGLLGVPASGTGAEWLARIHPDDRERVHEAFRQRTPESAYYRVEYRVRSADGSWRWVRESGEAGFDESRLERVIGVCADDQPRHHAEEERRRAYETLRTSDERLRLMHQAGLRLSSTLDLDLIYETLRELVSQVMPCDGMVVSSFDRAASRVHAVYLWSAGRRLDASALPPLVLDLEGPGMQTEVIRTGEGRLFGDVRARVQEPGRYYDVGADGRPRDLKSPEADPPVARSALMVPIKVEGRVVGALQVSSDRPGVYGREHLELLEALVSPVGVAIHNAELYARALHEVAERRIAEGESQRAREELLRHKERLELDVRERTAKLEEKIAELEMLSFGISHDMRAPLRAMAGFARLLIQDHAGSLDVQGQGYLQRIERAAGRMDRLIRDVLTWSRVARDHLPSERVVLHRLAEDLVENDPALQPPHARVRIAGPLPEVMGNEAQLAQVLANLLGNATKFIERGRQPEIEIGAERIDDRVRVWVQDNGIGIPPERHERIFELFGQAHEGEGFEGTGIGLAVVQKAVEHMGGEVGVVSSAGSGSRFWFTLPAAGDRLTHGAAGAGDARAAGANAGEPRLTGADAGEPRLTGADAGGAAITGAGSRAPGAPAPLTPR